MTRAQVEEIIKALLALREDATDETAIKATAIYPTLKYNGALVKSGTRINWNGTLKRAAADLWDTEDNNPDNAPVLWENVVIVGEYRIIPEVITIGLVFSEGEYGWWKGVLYRSMVNSNVYTPDQYPQNWEVVESSG